MCRTDEVLFLPSFNWNPSEKAKKTSSLSMVEIIAGSRQDTGWPVSYIVATQSNKKPFHTVCFTYFTVKRAIKVNDLGAGLRSSPA